MDFSQFMGWGAIFLGVMIGLTAALKWPNWVNYIWAVLALLWGVYGLV